MPRTLAPTPKPSWLVSSKVPTESPSREQGYGKWESEVGLGGAIVWQGDESLREGASPLLQFLGSYITHLFCCIKNYFSPTTLICPSGVGEAGEKKIG